MRSFDDLKIALVGTGYVGLSIATLLSQHHQVTAIDINTVKVEKMCLISTPLLKKFFHGDMAHTTQSKRFS